MTKQKFDMNDLNIEVRFWSEGSLMVSSNDIKMIKFDLEMKQHFEREKEKHEDTILVLKLQKSLWRLW